MKAICPRPEHPRPQFERKDWINLNGTWTFAFDHGDSGRARGFAESAGFDREITVPFAPESTLSGVGHTDFIEHMWYHRTITVPKAWTEKRVLLHFGAVDYESEVFIDGHAIGQHWGGSASFTHDITAFVSAGSTHNLVVRVADHLRGGHQPSGKQCPHFHSRGCHYTRTTGIWQTVWLEAVAPCGLSGLQITPDLEGARFVLTPRYHAVQQGSSIIIRIKNGSRIVAEAEAAALDGVPVLATIPDVKPWSPEKPFLYKLECEVRDAEGSCIDRVLSYAGMRKLHVEGNRVFLNNKPLYQRLVLDQGFYPDGIWTAPSDAALKRDIELAKKAGFNGARLHQKVFEERFHYWADKLGYLTWGESASWGLDVNTIPSARNFLSEWAEIVERDRNHPSIIAWTPFNETWDFRDPGQHRRLHADAYALTKALDPTRPVNDASGSIHTRTDLYTVHHYEQDGAKLKERLALLEKGSVWSAFPKEDAPYEGQPYLIDEFGGIKWIDPELGPFAGNAWGYGEGPKTLDELYDRLESLVDAILAHGHVAGYCYTQLTDVEQEQNGIYNYDRSEKFDMKRIASIFRKMPGGYA